MQPSYQAYSLQVELESDGALVQLVWAAQPALARDNSGYGSVICERPPKR